jgi:hypothetical protein
MTPTEIFRSDRPDHVAATEALLSKRMARCSCGNAQPSSPSLAFFEFNGEGSNIVKGCNSCGKYDVVHWPINPNTGRAGITDHEFIPRLPMPTDTYYCGCRGWD